jgi:hypothetical protein
MRAAQQQCCATGGVVNVSDSCDQVKIDRAMVARSGCYGDLL